MIKRSFGAVVNADVRLLVLGSLPGEESLARGQYYANPRNQFWLLMSAATGIGLLPLAYEERLRALLGAHVGLWDVVGAARREGSLDSAIRGHEANPLTALIATLPNLRAIGFNGGTAARIGRKAIGETRVALIPLPSSSPAFTLPFDDKKRHWMELGRFLDSAGGEGL